MSVFRARSDPTYLCSQYIQAINHALLHLAESPHHLQTLRQEAEQILQDEGWTKTSLGKLHLLDSFLRESQRLNGVNTSMFPPCRDS